MSGDSDQVIAPFPWQTGQWSVLSQSAASGRMHHATLLSGPRGTGKLSFAIELCKLLLCEQFAANQPTACDNCERCHLLNAGTHPDFTLVDWLDKSSVISVDQIRKLSEKLFLTSTYGPYRIAIINRADTMTPAAYNSLLKTLEEPPGNCVLFLIAARDSALPATIHSRCQRVVMPVPARSITLSWLQTQNVAQPEIAAEFARGAPLLAKSYASERDLAAISNIRNEWLEFIQGEKSPAALAAEAANVLDTSESLTLFMQWTTDLARNVEFSVANGRLTLEGVLTERRFLSQTLQLLQQSQHFDNASLKTLAVLEGVLADIRIQRMRIRAESTT